MNMGKENDLKRFTRIIKLLNILSAGTLVVADTAIDMGVSTRTIQRDIRTIEDAGFPIYDKKPGQICFEEGFSLKQAKLSNEEAAMLALISDMVRPLGANFEKSFNSLRNKVLARSTDSPYFIKMPKTKGYPKNEVTDKIAEAIERKEKIYLKYYKDEKLLDYDASPLKIANYEGFWYLLCLNKSGKFRAHKLDKFISCELIGKYFNPPKSLEKYLKESVNIWTEPEKKMKVVVKVSPKISDYFKAKEIFPLQKVTKKWKDGSLTIEGCVSKSREARHIILQWMPHITIVQPKDLKIEIKTLLKESLCKI
jgi:predicted DNA-binding transcriptional regulator YafY